MFEYRKQMRLHVLHFAKFAALVALAVVMTHTLGSHTTGSPERARPVARAAKSRVHLDAGGILLFGRSGDTVAIGSAVETGKNNERSHVAAASPLALGNYAADQVTAQPSDGIISDIADELKSAVTLLRAYSQWIRSSPESIS